MTPANADPRQERIPMADDPLLDQDEIERLLNQAGGPGAEKDTAAAAPADSGAAASSAAKDAAPLVQDDVERLLNQAGQAGTAPGPTTAVAASVRDAAPGLLPGEGSMTPRDIDYLLAQAEQALESVETVGQGDLPPGVRSFHLEELAGAPPSEEAATLDLVRDVELDLRIELGRTHMYLEDVLKLRRGAVVPLDKLAGDPVDIYVNDRLIARGEVLVLNENFCVRVAELVVGDGAFA
jgi:flagellar motor switch protein FliN